MNATKPTEHKTVIKGLIQTIYLFILTFKYLIQSYLYPKNILKLKQQWAQQAIQWMGYQLESSGKIHPDNKVIFVGNHISFIDILVLMAIHPRISFVAKKEIRSWPIIGWGAQRIGTVFVDRNNKQSRSTAKDQLIQSFANKSELHLALFPSGTTQLSELKPWKKGIFEVAHQTQTPIQMFYIHYEPPRESAYIDDDHLFTKLIEVFQKKNKKVKIVWGPIILSKDPIMEASTTRLWTLQEALCH